MSEKPVAISIVNYGTAELTMACIRSVLADASDVARIIVVDNASPGGDTDRLEAAIAGLGESAPVTLLRSPTNSGFSGGHNQGIAASNADFVLVLNSDAELRKGCIASLLAAAAEDPCSGILAPRLEWEDGTPQTSCFRLPTPFSELIRGAASGPVTRVLRRYDVPLGTDPEAGEIGWVSFACVLLRREMIEAIGPMDEGFFLYFEDTEYCWRARKAGWTIRHVPTARVVHHRGGSAPVKKLAAARRRLPAYFYASRSRCFRILHGTAGLLAANILWFMGRGVAQLRRILGKDVPQAIDREARDIWINFLDPMGPDRRPEG